MKETFYFSHDYAARSDPKIKKLICKLGMSGYGVFWSIIEDLYQNDNLLPLDYETMCYDLRVEESVLKSIINDFELFFIKEKYFGSNSAQKRLQKRTEKSEKAQTSAKKRWEKHDLQNTDIKKVRKNKMRTQCKTDANAMPSQCDSNANKVKESKVKESKVNYREGFINKEKDNSLSTGYINITTEEKEDFETKKIVSNSLHHEIIKIHSDFYKKKVDEKYKFSAGADGKAVKDLIKYLKNAIKEKNVAGKKEITEATDEEVIVGFNKILENFDKWENFYQQKLKLVEICSNLPNIMANIRLGKKDNKQIHSKSDNYKTLLEIDLSQVSTPNLITTQQNQPNEHTTD